MAKRSDEAYSRWRQASERQDYFVTGLTGALAAYIGQTLEPTRLGWNPQTVELIALVMLVGSIVLGFLRIETATEILRLTHHALSHQEAAGAKLKASKAGGSHLNEATGSIHDADELAVEAALHRKSAKDARVRMGALPEQSANYYHARNRWLFAGFVTLVIARILPAYM